MTAASTVGVGIVLLYWVGLTLTRWMFIARPNRRFTLARIDHAKFSLEGPDESGPTLLDEARDVCLGVDHARRPDWWQLRQNHDVGDQPEERGPKKALRTFFGPLVWNGSHDLVAWGLMHRVEAAAAGRLTGPSLVARLMRAQSQLDELPARKRDYWGHILDGLLTGAPAKQFDDAFGQAVLASILTDLYDARDTKFTNLATQQNKVTWLVFIGLTLIIVLLASGYQDIVLAGAVGGVLSRALRELKRRDVPSDYGLSWSLLFLAPVTGALAAWGGLLLLQTLQSLDVLDLSGVLPKSTDLTDPAGSVLGVAVLFGISERLLDRLVHQATDSIATESDDKPVERPSSDRRGLLAGRALDDD